MKLSLIDYQPGIGSIIEDTPTYSLFSSDISSDPGFLELIPKKITNRRNWILSAMSHLQAFSDIRNILNVEDPVKFVTYQPSQRFSFDYKGGLIRVHPNEERIWIAESHPERQKIIFELLKLRNLKKSFVSYDLGLQKSANVEYKYGYGPIVEDTALYTLYATDKS